MGFDALFDRSIRRAAAVHVSGGAAKATKSPRPTALDLHQFKTKARFLRLY
jgi:hypothetical protein